METVYTLIGVLFLISFFGFLITIVNYSSLKEELERMRKYIKGDFLDIKKEYLVKTKVHFYRVKEGFGTYGLYKKRKENIAKREFDLLKEGLEVVDETK